MNVFTSEQGELVFAWNHFGESELRFSLCENDNELLVTGNISMRPGFNILGGTTLQVHTVWYARALLFFARDLRAFHCGEAAEVALIGEGGEFELRLPAKPRFYEGQQNFSPTIAGWELRCLAHQRFYADNFWAELRLLLGEPGDLFAAAAEIESYLTAFRLNTERT